MSQQILSKSIKKANISLKMEQTMTTTTIEDLCKPNDLLHNRFTIIKKLTAGTFGQIYVAKDNKSKDLDVAIKVESSVGSVVQLPLEVMVMKQYQGKVHGTTLVCYGCERDFIQTYLSKMNHESSQNSIISLEVMSISLTSKQYQDLSRADDLISLFYVFLDLYTNNLPWAGATDYAKTLELKEKYDIIWLTGRLPSKFKTIAQHIKSLKFCDDPNYGLLLKLVNDVVQENNIINNAPWDWEDNFINLNRNLIDLKDSETVSSTSRSMSSKTKKGAA